MNARQMLKHADCAQVCQQADAYGVWPEHSCNPRCVWIDVDAWKQSDEYQRDAIAGAQSTMPDDTPEEL